MFKDRKDAGRKLAQKLLNFRSEKCIVYGLPRGGIPVAYEIAMSLSAKLEALIVKKISLPEHEELAIGAVAEGDPPVFYFNTKLMDLVKVQRDSIQSQIERKLRDIEDMQNLYRGTNSMYLDRSAVAIIVDDGIATGATVMAAINRLREAGQPEIIVAVPAGQISILKHIEEHVDRLICLNSVHSMYAVGEFYEDFSQIPHDTVVQMLQNASRW